MGGAYRVHPHVLHDAQLSPRRAHVERHAKRTEIRMKVDALDLHALAVDVQAIVRRPLDRADAVAVDAPA